MLDVILLRGAPGVGKSTLARGLRNSLQSGAVLEVDDFRSMQAIDWESEAQHDIAVDVALTACARFIAAGVRPVIVVDTFCSGRLPAVQARLSGHRHLTVSLWLEPDALRARMEARGSGFTHWPSSRAVNHEVWSARYLHEIMVGVGGLSAPQLVDRVAQILQLQIGGASEKSPQCPA